MNLDSLCLDSTVGRRFKEIFSSLSVVSDEVESLRSELLKSQSELVFCHNDLLCGNLIYNDVTGMSLTQNVIMKLK